MLRRDLEAAGIPYETPEGVADLHALRVSYATILARAGVSLVQAQRLMRHSDPKLTANIYTRLRLDDAHAAVARIDLGATPARLAR
jgi:integrase